MSNPQEFNQRLCLDDFQASLCLCRTLAHKNSNSGSHHPAISFLMLKFAIAVPIALFYRKQPTERSLDSQISQLETEVSLLLSKLPLSITATFCLSK